MRNTILAAAAGFALVVATAPSFAAATNSNGANPANQGQAQSDSSNTDSQCANILADRAGHSASEVEYCQSKY